MTIDADTPRFAFACKLVGLAQRAIRGLDWLAPLADLVIRIWVANVFWRSGLTKIESFDTTLQLFRYEYSVPLLPPDVAAYLATFTELTFSVLLTIGLAGRSKPASTFHPMQIRGWRTDRWAKRSRSAQ